MWIGYIFERNYGSGGLQKKVCKRKSVALCPVSYITGMLHHLFSAFTLFLDFSTISHETSEHNLLVNTTWDCWQQQQQKSHEQQESLIFDQKTKQLNRGRKVSSLLCHNLTNVVGEELWVINLFLAGLVHRQELNMHKNNKRLRMRGQHTNQPSDCTIHFLNWCNIYSTRQQKWFM